MHLFTTFVLRGGQFVSRSSFGSLTSYPHSYNYRLGYKGFFFLLCSSLMNLNVQLSIRVHILTQQFTLNQFILRVCVCVSSWKNSLKWQDLKSQVFPKLFQLSRKWKLFNQFLLLNWEWMKLKIN